LGLPLAGDERSAAGEALDHDSSGQDLREDPRHVKETSLAYNAGQRMNDGGELVWVSAETWRNYALPNVFLRILGHYFADKRTS
jgi:hypothetical protein